MTQHYVELRCAGCGWAEVCGAEGVARWLRGLKKVRPGKEPEPEILFELLRGAAGQLACARCGRNGLCVGPLPDDDDSVWADEPVCSSCLGPIARERLEVVPGTRLCMACQRAQESGRTTGVEYCPRCGSPMELRLSRSGGVSRYVMACTADPPCRL